MWQQNACGDRLIVTSDGMVDAILEAARAAIDANRQSMSQDEVFECMSPLGAQSHQGRCHGRAIGLKKASAGIPASSV